jgi:hypothetical protein
LVPRPGDVVRTDLGCTHRANLSDQYFENRQDRYVCIADAAVADYFGDVVKTGMCRAAACVVIYTLDSMQSSRVNRCFAVPAVMGISFTLTPSGELAAPSDVPDMFDVCAVAFRVSCAATDCAYTASLCSRAFVFTQEVARFEDHARTRLESLLRRPGSMYGRQSFVRISNAAGACLGSAAARGSWSCHYTLRYLYEKAVVNARTDNVLPPAARCVLNR